MNEPSPQLKALLDKALGPYPEARQFIQCFSALGHCVDDLVDRDRKDITDWRLFTVDTFALAMDVYSSPFYLKNASWLYPVCSHLHRLWVDSVVWEKSDDPWKRDYADKIRCCGNEIICAVLQHIAHLPYPQIREISLLMREDAYRRDQEEEQKK